MQMAGHKKRTVSVKEYTVSRYLFGFRQISEVNILVQKMQIFTVQQFCERLASLVVKTL